MHAHIYENPHNEEASSQSNCNSQQSYQEEDKIQEDYVLCIVFDIRWRELVPESHLALVRLIDLAVSQDGDDNGDEDEGETRDQVS